MLKVVGIFMGSLENIFFFKAKMICYGACSCTLR